MLVKDYMTTNPTTVSPGDRASEIINKMKGLGYSQLPVVENRKLIGIVTEKGLSRALGSMGPVSADKVMLDDPVTILEEASIENAADIIRKVDINILPVVTKEGDLVGIVSVSDILDALRDKFSFNEKPIKLEVKTSPGLGLFDVLHLVEANSDKVLSFSSAPLDRSVCYFWVVDSDLGRIEKVLRENGCKVTVVHS